MPTLKPRSRHPQGPGRRLEDGTGPQARRPDRVARLCLGLAIIGALIGLVGFVALNESQALTLSRIVTGAALLIWLVTKVVRRRRSAAADQPR
ncbi:hypothetical protein [Nocardioides aurantiacus]|uniref:Uncharacterized protein n=1 Tax=Nocardioides aurantiacus TaxID=86796 RepID=A0A3N2CTL4_9ACTN|nr:hypothetical protein [Nocardioides aurantiacus]ROR90880.1 hypothetical protein EDD33_1729 [Nocardioides aurantiacus]